MDRYLRSTWEEVKIKPKSRIPGRWRDVSHDDVALLQHHNLHPEAVVCMCETDGGGERRGKVRRGGE